MGTRPRRAGRRRNGRSSAHRRQPGQMKRLARIDVAQPGHDALIEQCCFQRGVFAFARTRQDFPVELRRQGLGPEPAEDGMTGQLARCQQVHCSKTARIVERDSHTRRQVEHDVIVSSGPNRFLAGRSGCGPVRQVDPERPGHSEVHDQRVSGRQGREQILAAPRQRLDPLIFQAPLKVTRKRCAQVGPPEVDLRDPGMVEMRIESAADRLDFRKLRQGYLAGMIP